MAASESGIFVKPFYARSWKIVTNVLLKSCGVNVARFLKYVFKPFSSLSMNEL